MEARLLFLPHPPSGLRLADAERRAARPVAVPPAAAVTGGAPRVAAADVVAAARAHRVAPAAPLPLRLSLHGMVLAPDDDVAELLEGLPERTRSRVVFLLTPAEDTAHAPSPRRVAFADELVSSPPAAQRGERAVTGHCLFRESWLNPKRCVKCHRARTQHSLFAPTPQHYVERAMTRSTSRHISPFGHAHPNSSSALVGVGGSLPHYADPQQWEPRRGAQYHATSEVCKNFVELWGKADLCARCRHVRSAHEIREPPTPLHQQREGPRRSISRRRSPTSTSPKRSLVACGRFIPVWGNNDYCSTCYMLRGKHSKKALRSPHPYAAPRQIAKATPFTPVDWLDALPQASESVRRAAGELRSAATSVSSEDTDVSATAVNAAGLNGGATRSGRSSAIPTPQKALNFSAVATTSRKDSCAVTPKDKARRAHSASPLCHLLWSKVLRFATIEVLLVCRSVCSSLRDAAVPLLRVNCRFIVETMDIPSGTRGPLLRCARFCAAVMANATRQRRGGHSDPFLRCCVRHFLRALYALAGTRTQHTSRRHLESEDNCGLLLSPPGVSEATTAEKFFDTASEGVEDDVSFIRTEENTINEIFTAIQKAARCDVNALSGRTLRCVSTAFEEVHIAAAASFALNVERCERVESDKAAPSSYAVSLTEFFDHYGLLPLVDYLNALEAVAHMKTKAHCWLERVHNFR